MTSFWPQEWSCLFCFIKSTFLYPLHKLSRGIVLFVTLPGETQCCIPLLLLISAHVTIILPVVVMFDSILILGNLSFVQIYFNTASSRVQTCYSFKINLLPALLLFPSFKPPQPDVQWSNSDSVTDQLETPLPPTVSSISQRSNDLRSVWRWCIVEMSLSDVSSQNEDSIKAVNGCFFSSIFIWTKVLYRNKFLVLSTHRAI